MPACLRRARNMCRWLKKKPRGIYRVLHSAAAIRRRRMVVGVKAEAIPQSLRLLAKTDSLPGLL